MAELGGDAEGHGDSRMKIHLELRLAMRVKASNGPRYGFNVCGVLGREEAGQREKGGGGGGAGMADGGGDGDGDGDGEDGGEGEDGGDDVEGAAAAVRR